MTLSNRAIGAGVAALAGLTKVIGRRAFAVSQRQSVGHVDSSAIERILVVRLDEIGDAVMNVPLLRALRRHFPNAHITVVMRPAGAALMAACPYIDALHSLEGPSFGASRIPGRYRRALAFSRERFTEASYDLALVPRWEVDKYFATSIAYWSGARWRVGYSEHVSAEKGIKNRGWDSLLTHALPGGHGEHEVRRALGIAGFLGAPTDDDALELWTNPDDRAAAERLLTDSGVEPGEPLLALAPGAGLPRREWPATRLADVGRRLATRAGLRPVILGGPQDRASGRSLVSELGPETVDLTGRAGLRETVEVLRRCGLFIGNDSGPMHLAAAAGVPVVAISCHPRGGDPEHHNAPERFGPWRTPSVVVRPGNPRSPCADGCERDEPHCILGISVDAVHDAALSLLEHPAARREASILPARAVS